MSSTEDEDEEGGAMNKMGVQRQDDCPPRVSPLTVLFFGDLDGTARRPYPAFIYE